MVPQQYFPGRTTGQKDSTPKNLIKAVPLDIIKAHGKLYLRSVHTERELREKNMRINRKAKV